MKVICFAVFAVFVCGFCVDKSGAWEPFNPEEALFVFSRCTEDNIQDKWERLRDWAVWDLKPDDEITGCYVRCVLTGLELFDESSNKFQVDRFESLHDKYKQYTGVADEKVKQFLNSVELLNPLQDSKCVTVLKAYKNLYSEHEHTFRSLLHGYSEINKLIYDADMENKIKKKDESYFAFCEKKYYPLPENKEVLCKIRKYGIDDDDRTFAQHTDCLFHGLRYLDQDEKINAAEIKRDFKQVGLDRDAEIDKTLHDCGETDALGYYKCLVRVLKKDFSQAFDYREIRSKDYDYKLYPQNRKYDEAKITAEVKKIDDGLGCI